MVLCACTIHTALISVPPLDCFVLCPLSTHTFHSHSLYTYDLHQVQRTGNGTITTKDFLSAVDFKQQRPNLLVIMLAGTSPIHARYNACIPPSLASFLHHPMYSTEFSHIW